MRCLVFCLLMCLSVSLSAQTFTSSCTGNPTIEKVYRNDAYKIATDRVRKLNLNWKDSVEIPEIYIDTIARAFYAIDNMSWSKLKDTIRTLFGHSQFNATGGPQSDSSHIYSCNSFSGCNISCKTISVRVSATANWYSAWQAGNYYNTPNAEINSLMALYNITVTPWVDFSTFFRIFYVKASRAINPYGMIAIFTNVNGVMDAEVSNTAGDGNSINMQYLTDGLKLTFRSGCGDCPAGCTYGRIWEFKYLYADCSIEYLGANNFGFTGDFSDATPYTCSNTIMPVDMSQLIIQLDDSKPQLQWKVFSQTDLKEFVIERSNNGATFEKVTTLLPSNRSLPALYSWTDGLALGGRLFYRIKVVSTNGEYRYSNIADVKLNNDKDEFILLANPVINKKIGVRINSIQQQKGRLTVLNYSGHKIYAVDLKLQQGLNDLDVQLPLNLVSGYYIISLNTNNIVMNRKCIIK